MTTAESYAAFQASMTARLPDWFDHRKPGMRSSAFAGPQVDGRTIRRGGRHLGQRPDKSAPSKP